MQKRKRFKKTKKTFFFSPSTLKENTPEQDFCIKSFFFFFLREEETRKENKKRLKIYMKK